MLVHGLVRLVNEAGHSHVHIVLLEQLARDRSLDLGVQSHQLVRSLGVQRTLLVATLVVKIVPRNGACTLQHKHRCCRIESSLLAYLGLVKLVHKRGLQLIDDV